MADTTPISLTPTDKEVREQIDIKKMVEEQALDILTEKKNEYYNRTRELLIKQENLESQARKDEQAAEKSRKKADEHQARIDKFIKESDWSVVLNQGNKQNKKEEN